MTPPNVRRLALQALLGLVVMWCAVWLVCVDFEWWAAIGLSVALPAAVWMQRKEK